MDTFLSILFWGAIAYGVWYLIVKRRPSGISSSGVENPVTVIPRSEPVINDVMGKLEQIEKRMGHIEAQTKNIEKSVKDTKGMIWGIVIGGLIGFFWSDILTWLISRNG